MSITAQRAEETVPRTHPRLLRLDRPVAWWIVSIVAVFVVAVFRVLQTARFFFWDDTQLGAYGQWYGLGSRILQGDVTLLSPGSWQGGNYLAEGQWGIFNPVTWVIAIGTHLVDSATVYATAVKILFLLLLTTGTFLLARSYGAAPQWAAVAGFTASMGGQTIFMDAPSWVTGLQNVAFFAFAWWALKKHVEDRSSPILFFVFAYLLVTVGYVFGVIELAFLLFVFLAERSIARDRDAVVRTLVLGVYAALLTVFVYLPGILTSPVTARAGADILNDQFLNMDLGDLATSSIVTATSSVRGYWGDIVPVPLQYVSWLLPLLVLCGRWRQSLRTLLIPMIVLAFSVALVVGPSVIGPLRYPARMMPYVVLVVAVLLAVVMSNGLRVPVPRNRAWLAVAVTGVSAFISWAAQPASWGWVGLAFVLQGGAILALSARGRLATLTMTSKRAAAYLLATSVALMGVQAYHYPSSPLGNFNVPSSVEAMQSVGDDMESGIMVVGDVYSLQFAPDSYEESLIANLWYLSGKDSASVYTVLPFKALSDQLCVDLRGWTCPEAYDELFDPVPGQDEVLADDLALNTVVVIKAQELRDLGDAPSGWSIEEREHTFLLTRDEPVSEAGGIARVEGDAEVSVLARDDLSVTFSVESVGSGGASVVFSRLAWPGYATDGGELGDPDRDFLLTVDLTDADAGSTITVSFRPPGWGIELTAVGIAGLLAAAWTVLHLLARRRSRVA